MGALIQTAGLILSRVLIAIVAWAFTFVGNIGPTQNQTISTTTKDTIHPIFVEIEQGIVDIQKNKIIGSGTTTKDSSTKNKITANIEKPKVVIPKVSTSTKNLIPETKPIVENPSLKNLPVPSISLPQITNEINRGIALSDMANVYENSKQSVVNIFCVSTKGNMVSIATGSGVIISNNGIILTNSHVAENFLVPNKECLIRQGEIAVDKYKASLIYINENWLKKNAGVLFSTSARGTGENDFALLSINSKNDGSNFSSNIPHTKINLREASEESIGNKILIAGYPAGTLGALSLRKYLNFVVDVIKISNVYTLDGSLVDVFETEITKVGQHGSSGGGVFDEENNLVGLIVSVSDESGHAKVNALTTTYINRAIKKETGKNLAEFVNTDKNILISNFLIKQNSLYEYVKPYVQ